MIGGKLNDSGGDPDNIEIFEMQEFEPDKKVQKKTSLKSSVKGSFKGRESGKKQMEMGKLNKMQHYVIDDGSDEEDQSSKASSSKQTEGSSSKVGGNRPAREIVFDEEDL